MRRFIVIILVVAVLLLIANDAVRYIETQRKLSDTTYTIARYAAENAPSMSRDKVARQMVDMAAPSGVTVTMYGQNDKGVQVWTQAEVSGTILARPVINAMLNKKSTEPLLVKDYREAGIQ